jgi:hypothetical protein
LIEKTLGSERCSEPHPLSRWQRFYARLRWRKTVTPGQYRGVTQYTGLIDPEGLCGGVAGLAVGQLTTTVATVAGLGITWTSTIANANPTPSTPYGVGWINCAFAALPNTGDFSPVSVGTATEYVATPTAPQTTSCFASNGVPYQLGSSNGTANGEPQTNTITILPTNGTGLDSGFRVTTTNTTVTVNNNVLCFLSTDALYLLSN